MQTQLRAARNYWHTHNTGARAISVPLQGCTVPPSGPTARLQRGMNTHTHRPEDQSHSIIQYKTIYFLHRGSLFVVFSSLCVPLLNHLFFLNILRLDLVSFFSPHHAIQNRRFYSPVKAAEEQSPAENNCVYHTFSKEQGDAH